MTRSVRSVLALAAVAPIGVVAGQQPVFRASTDVVSVDVSVRAGNRPVAGLAAADFKVFDNGVPQRIDTFSLETLPIDVTLLLDVSGSVEGRLLERLKLGVVETAKLLRQEDALRLIAVQNRIHLVFPFQPGGVRPEVDALVAQGGTSLFDSLAAALMRPTAPDRRQLVIAYTDGQDTLSVLDAATAGDVARHADGVVHLVVPIDAARAKQPDAALLRDLAAQTGGQLFYVGVADPITDAFTHAIDEFRTSYILRYIPAGVKREGWHDLTVRVKTGQYDVRAKKGYSGG